MAAISAIRLTRHLTSRLLVALAIVSIAACSSVPERHPYIGDEPVLGSIIDAPGIRFWGDEAPPNFLERISNIDPERVKKNQPGLYGTEHDYLAISGGGQHGAFSAGMMVGWTKTGTRPNFEMVTGISTGALMAPFVFLGPKYDPILKEIYGTYSTDDLIKKYGLIKAITGNAMASSEPLKTLLGHYISPQIVAELAEAHKQGRRLFIGTTNLDALRPVTWSLTAIAASGHPQARELIIDVVLASASLPGAFPPVLFQVEINGQTYDELHVDGGAASQLFIYPSAVDWKLVAKQLNVKGKPQVWVMRNSRLDPQYKPIKGSILSIINSSVSSLIRTQGIGDLFQVYANTVRDDLEFNLAYIPADFDVESDEEFDVEYMRALFDYGYRLMINGYEWHSQPPNFRRATLPPDTPSQGTSD